MPAMIRPASPRPSSLLLAAVIAIAPVVGACESGGETDESETPPTAEDGLRVTLSIDRPAYLPGDSLIASLSLSNAADEPSELAFTTSQRYDFVILDSDRSELLRWSEERGFLQVLGELSLAQEGPPLTWSERLPVPAEPGRYILRGEVPATGATLSAELPFEVASGG